MKLAGLCSAALAGLLLAGCPSDPHSIDTWTHMLENPKEMERAVTELEHLCNPAAIPALGKAWERDGSTRLLQVIIDLARPMTPEQADEKNCTDYFKSGRPENWAAALPFLRKAIEDLETTSQRSIDAAVKAAEAIGSAGLTEGTQVLVDVVNRKMGPKDNGQRVRLTAIASLGKFKDKGAVTTLANVIRADQGSQPPQVVGAAINALGETRSPDAVPVLLESMYRVPLFFAQIRRALVAAGGDLVKGELRKILRGEHAEINALFKEQKLDKYCGDDGKSPPDECQEVAPMPYYAAIIVGDLYDREAVPDLVKALGAKLKPAYFSNFNAGPPAHNAILDALRKIGDPSAAPAVLALWADPKADEQLRPVAASVYGFVSVDGSEKTGTTTGVALLGKVAADNAANQALRLACAESFARLGSTKADIDVMLALAKKYADASAEARKKADGEPKKKFDAAQKQFDEVKTAYDTTKMALDKAKAEAGGDVTKVDAAVIEAATKAKEAFDKVKKETYTPARQEFDGYKQQVEGYKGYQRSFELHAARIALALECAGDLGCTEKAFTAKPDEVFTKLQGAKYIAQTDAADWTADDKKGLRAAQIERAVVELRKQGDKASGKVGALLELAKANLEERLIRQAILLTLPRVAKVPAPDVEAGLEAVIKASQGKQEFNDLNNETQLVRTYFGWAGK